ncbi:MAG TPA: Asp23/Gls24 family envelope stress response protein [Leptolinea sp.]|jgi:uncharacterized alkaline shock family protein YloU
MSESNNKFGNIFISHRAIATIACQSALESYGVVGLAAKNLAEGLAQILVKDPTLGVEVQFDGHSILIDLFIIVEYGTRITSVSSSIADSVAYQIEKTLGIPVSHVNIHVRGLRISNPD